MSQIQDIMDDSTEGKSLYDLPYIFRDLKKYFEYRDKRLTALEARVQDYIQPLTPISIKLLYPDIDGIIPKYSSEEAAGLDLRAISDCNTVENGKQVSKLLTEPVKIQPNGIFVFGSGIAIDINDPTTSFQIYPRSGLGSRQGIVIANLTGIIDSDYHGEIMLTLWNRSKFEFTVNLGDRVCQGIFTKVQRRQFEVVTEFSRKTVRGTGGLGHTGVK